MELFSTREPVPSATSEVNRTMLVHIVKAIETNNFCAHFKNCGIHVKEFI